MKSVWFVVITMMLLAVVFGPSVISENIEKNITIGENNSIGLEGPVFSYSADEQAIINAYANMSAAFVNENLTAVMSYFSDDFLHSGEDKNKLQAEFQDFFNNYYDIRVNFTDIQISVNGSYAKTTHRLIVIAKPNGTGVDEVIVDEYESDGWFNYWKKNGEWKIYGNQEKVFIKVRTKYWESGLYQISISAETIASDVSSISISGPSYIDTATVHGGGDPHFLYDDGMHYDDEANDGYWAAYLDIIEVPNVGDNIIFNITYANGSTEIKQKNITGVFDETTILISPEDGATVKTKTPTFLWQSLSIPNLSYSLQIDDEYHNRIYEVYNLKTTNHTIPKNYLQNKKTYYWLVSAEDENGNEALTNWRTFTTDFIIPNYTVSGDVKDYTNAIKQMMVVAFENGTVINISTIVDIEPVDAEPVIAGKYTLVLPWGTYFISLGTVTLSGEEVSSFTVLDIRFNVDVDRNLTDINFSVSSVGGNLTGIIKNEYMLPVTDATIVAMQDKNFSGFTVTDINGTYFMPHLRSGIYNIWVRRANQTFWVPNISITENKKTILNFILKNWTISGTINDLTGGKIKHNLSIVAFPAGTIINVTNEIEPTVFIEFANPGNYNISVPVGTYDIYLGAMLSQDEYTRFWTLLDKKLDVTVTNGSVSGVNFAITSVGGNLTGFVTAGTSMVIRPEVLVMKGNEFFGFAETDENGTYFIPYIRPGVYEVWASDECYNPNVKTNIVINESKETILNLTLKKRGFITDYYYDYPFDIDGDGFYDYLAIEIGLNITEANYYYIWGRLFANESYVAYASNYTYLTPGSRKMTLLFRGNDIYSSGMNSPYLLHIGLEKGYEYYHIDCREPAYAVLNYNYTQFQKPPAKFTDVYNDYGLDTDGNGLYDQLIIEVGVNVTTAGNYQLRGELADIIGYYGDYYGPLYAYNYTYLDVGLHDVALRFDGRKIYASRINGQHPLKNLYLYDGYWAQLDYRYHAYNTTAYNYTEFQKPVAYFTQEYNDYGFDTDGDGFYDYLVIAVSVNVTGGEDYKIYLYGYLYAMNGTLITAASNMTYLSNGTRIVNLVFNGIPIYMSKINGTYNLKSLSLMDYWSLSYIDNIYDAYNTSSYNYTQFQRPGAQLTGNYSEYGLDTDGNGLYDYLVIEAFVNVTKPGRYKLSGGLDINYSWEGYYYLSNETDLSTGIQTIKFYVDGTKIYAAKTNGPYPVKYLYLYDERGTTLNYVVNPYSTSAYNYTQFQRPVAYFNQQYSDYGLDTDGNGLFEYLVFEVGANVTKDDYYYILAYLSDKNNNYISSATNYTFLNNGTQTVKLFFDNIAIYQHGVDGPYQIIGLHIYRYYYYDAYLDKVNKPYNTYPYRYTDFQPPPAELTGTYSDFGKDVNGDGLYDYLTVQTGVYVREAGYYKLGGYLCYRDYPYECWPYQWGENRTYLDVGTQTISIDFDGTEIYNSKVNGSYYFTSYLYDDRSRLLGHGEHRTSYYNCTQFEKPSHISIKPESILLWLVNQTRNLTLFNDGETTLDITSAATNVGWISVLNLMPIRLMPGENITLQTMLKPTAAGYYYVNFSFIANYPVSDIVHISIYDPQYSFSIYSPYMSMTVGAGEKKTIEINLYNTVPFPGNFSVFVSGLNESWYSLDASNIYAAPWEGRNIPLNIMIPNDCSLVGTYYFNVSAKINDINYAKTINFQMDVVAQPRLSNIVPPHNSRVGSENVLFAWDANVNSTTELFYKMHNDTSYLYASGEPGLRHSIIVNNLTRYIYFDYYVRSNSTCGSSTSDTKTFYIDKAIIFENRFYNFTIERDYNQQRQISVKNNDYKPHKLLLTISGAYEDLIMGFIGNGSIDQIITLEPGQYSYVALVIHAQDAMKEEYAFGINLTNLDNETGENIVDFANVHVHVHIPHYNFTMTEVSSDPITLEKRFEILNHGDPVTDLKVFANDELKTVLNFEPSINHANLGSGQTLSFNATPILAIGSTGVNGIIIAQAANLTLTSPASFMCNEGEAIYLGYIGKKNQTSGNSSFNSSLILSIKMGSEKQSSIDIQSSSITDDLCEIHAGECKCSKWECYGRCIKSKIGYLPPGLDTVAGEACQQCIYYKNPGGCAVCAFVLGISLEIATECASTCVGDPCTYNLCRPCQDVASDVANQYWCIDGVRHKLTCRCNGDEYYYKPDPCLGNMGCVNPGGQCVSCCVTENGCIANLEKSECEGQSGYIDWSPKPCSEEFRCDRGCCGTTNTKNCLSYGSYLNYNCEDISWAECLTRGDNEFWRKDESCTNVAKCWEVTVCGDNEICNTAKCVPKTGECDGINDTQEGFECNMYEERSCGTGQCRGTQKCSASCLWLSCSTENLPCDDGDPLTKNDMCKEGSCAGNYNIAEPPNDMDDWYCTNRPIIQSTFELPWYIGPHSPSNIVKAYLKINFQLQWSPSDYRPHNVTILLNNHEIGRLLNIIPSGQYIFEVDPAFLNYAVSGTARNTIILNTTHLNGGHYVVAADMQLIIHLNYIEGIEIPICAKNQTQANAVIANVTGLIIDLTDLGVQSRDIVLLKSNMSKDIFEGETVTIGALIHNIGATDVYTVVQFFDGNPYSGGQIGQNQTLVFFSFGSEPIFVEWNVTAGTHDIYVVIDPSNIVEEIDERNNIASKRIIVTFLAGDVNRDCKIDIFDLAGVGLAFGSRPGDARWNPNADVRKDDVINVFDLATVGKNFGRSC